jgi:hypothetical protein
MAIKVYISDTQAVDLIADMLTSGRPVSLVHVAGVLRSAGRDVSLETADDQ